MSKVDNMISDTGIIRNIINIANDINLEYRMSKLPKFIKDIRYKKYMKDLSKYIEKIKDIEIIDFNLLREFVNIFLDEEDADKYGCKGCKTLESSSNDIQSTFIFPIKESEDNNIGKVVVTFITHDETFDILYAVYLNSEEKGRFTRDKLSYIRLEKPDVDKYTEDIAYKGVYVNDIIFRSVRNDIYTYLIDYMERSERIIQNE